MNQFPTLRIGLEGVQYHVVHAFGEAMEEIKQYATSAIDASLTELRKEGLEQAIVLSVERTMREAIDEGIKRAVKEAVYEYFTEGRGQEFVVEAIVKNLGGVGDS